METIKVTDYDLVNLSDFVYQDIEHFISSRTLDTYFYINGIPRTDLGYLYPELSKSFISNLMIFPEYYKKTLEKFRLLNVANNKSFLEAGYYGAAFYNIDNGAVIIVNRGTKVNSIFKQRNGDLYTVFDVYPEDFKKQFLAGIEFYYRVAEICKRIEKCDGIYLTGHSFGGSITALMFIYFYGCDSLLKEMRTFDAPGIYHLISDEISSGKNKILPDIIKKGIWEGYNSLLRDNNRNLMIEYSTGLDSSCNNSLDYGLTKNPLHKEGFSSATNSLRHFSESELFLNNFNDIHSYKIYALKDGKIDCGCIDLINYLKIIIPIILSIKIDKEDTVEFLKRMYAGEICSPSDIYSFMIEKYYTPSLIESNCAFNSFIDHQEEIDKVEENLSLYNEEVESLYRYSLLFEIFIANGTACESSFITTAEELIASGFYEYYHHENNNEI